MTRRGFFGALAAFTVAPALPSKGRAVSCAPTPGIEQMWANGVIIRKREFACERYTISPDT